MNQGHSNNNWKDTDLPHHGGAKLAMHGEIQHDSYLQGVALTDGDDAELSSFNFHAQQATLPANMRLTNELASVSLEGSHSSHGSSKASSVSTSMPEFGSLLMAEGPGVFSEHFLGYWLKTLAFFFMFVAYNTLQGLAATVHGAVGSIAIAVLYGFFIIGNMIAPAIIRLFLHNNPASAMLVGSVFYVFFSIVNIIGGFGPLVLGAAGVGLGGGLLWVGQAVYLNRSARAAAKAWVEDGLAGRIAFPHPGLSSDEDVPIDGSAFPAPSEWTPKVMDAISSRLVGRMMGIFMATQMSTGIVGAVISWGILTKGWTAASSLDDATANMMFTVLTLISIIGALTLLFLLRGESLMVDIPARIDAALWERRQARVRNAQLDATALSSDGETIHLPDYSETLAEAETDVFADTSADTLAALDPGVTPATAWEIVGESLGNIYRIMRMRIGRYGAFVIIFGGIPICFAQSAFLAVAAVHVIGKANIPAALIVVGTSDFVCAMLMARLVSTLYRARMAILLSKVLLYAAVLTLLIHPYTNWEPNSTEAWVGVMFISALLGACDGTLNPSLSASHGMQFEPKYTPAAYGIASALKGFGSSVMFILAVTTSYDVMIWTLFAAGFISIGFEITLLHVIPYTTIMVEVETELPFERERGIVVEMTQKPHGHDEHDFGEDAELGDVHGLIHKRNAVRSEGHHLSHVQHSGVFFNAVDEGSDHD